MKKILLLSIILLSSQLNAQNLQFQWAGAMGGIMQDYSYGITLDKSGNSITTGYFKSTVDFNPGSGVANLTAVGLDDIFVSKLDASGNYVWGRGFGGNGVDYGYGVDVDTLGNIYVTGYFSDSVDFNPSGVVNGLLVSNGLKDIFILKLDATGNFVWVKQIGGAGDDIGFGIKLDNAGNIHVTGEFAQSADFNPSASSANMITSSGINDIFVLKLDANGDYVWAVGVGGTAEDSGVSIQVDASGNVYTTGYFTNSVDFDPSVNPALLLSNGSTDIFVYKLSASGAYVWAKNMGGTASDNAAGIALASNGDVCVSGSFQGVADFDPSAATSNLTSAGLHDSYVAKLSSAGTFVWAKQISGSNYDYSNNLTIDNSDNVYIVGQFMGAIDCDPGAGTYTATSNGTNDAYIVKLNSSGTFAWGYSFGGPTTDLIRDIAIDAALNIHITGVFINTVDFDPSSVVYNLTAVGVSDVFVQKLRQTVTGINDLGKNSLVKMYPNPSTGVINIMTDEIEIEQIAVFNQLGQAVLSSSEKFKKTVQLDLSNFPSGIYFISIQSGTNLFQDKIIIQ